MTGYGTAACLMFVFSAMPQLKVVFLGGSRHTGALAGLSTKGVMIFSLGGVMAASFTVALVALFISHCWFLLTNLTSVEVGYFGRNPYNMGMLHNAQQLMGQMELGWFLPIAPAEPLSDGLAFPTDEASSSIEMASPPIGAATDV